MTTIAIVGTGGTVQNTEQGRLPLAEVVEDVVRRGPGGLEGIDWTVEEVFNVGAETLSPPDWSTIATAVQAAVDRPDVDGVVVTHGTFTVEETAFALQLTLTTDKPVVMACSQRKHGLVGNDGDRNLVDALRVAASGDAAGMGVLVMVSDEIHSARDVTKEHQRLTGFVSALGPLGTAETDQVTFYRSPRRRHTRHSAFEVSSLAAFPRVDVVAAYAGGDATALDAFIAAGAQGIVTAGFAYNGVGTPVQLEAFEAAAARGTVIALASRGRGGRVPDSQRPWAVRADNLTFQKARILLGLGLTRTSEVKDLQELFDSH